MNTLFLVHVEEMFRDYFPDNMYLQRLIKACRANKYDRVFLLCAGIDDCPQPVIELKQVTNRDQYIEWSWGYDPESFDYDEDERSWVIPSYGHEYTWIPPERGLSLTGFDILNENIYESMIGKLSIVLGEVVDMDKKMELNLQESIEESTEKVIEETT